jgi:hypothetical protein
MGMSRAVVCRGRTEARLSRLSVSKKRRAFCARDRVDDAIEMVMKTRPQRTKNSIAQSKKGVYAAAITPFDANGNPDLDQLVAHRRNLLAVGCDGVAYVVCERVSDR